MSKVEKMTKHASGRHQKSTIKRITCKSDGLNSKELARACARSIKSLDEKQGIPPRVRMTIRFGHDTD